MSLSTAEHEPPFYLLTQPIANSSSQAAANFTHPIIEYHFADDLSSALLPSSDAESVIIVDYEDPDSTPIVQSLHHNCAIAGVKVTAAPGATAAPSARDGEPKRNDKMYIIETLSGTAGESGARESLCELDNPQLVLAQFRERNALLRRVLDQPSVKPSNPSSESEAPLAQIP